MDDWPEPIRVWEGHQESVRSVAFSGCGNYVLSASSIINKQTSRSPDPLNPDNVLRLWDFHKGKELRHSQTFNPGLAAVAFSPGGRFALHGYAGRWDGNTWKPGTDHTVRAWDMQMNRPLVFFRGSSAPVGKEAKQPDGDRRTERASSAMRPE